MSAIDGHPRIRIKFDEPVGAIALVVISERHEREFIGQIVLAFLLAPLFLKTRKQEEQGGAEFQRVLAYDPNESYLTRAKAVGVGKQVWRVVLPDDDHKLCAALLSPQLG